MNTEDKVELLEKGYIEIQSELKVLIEKTGDIAISMHSMSEAVSKFAVTKVRLDRIDTDLTGISGRLNKHSEKLDNTISSVALKWFAGIIVAYLISFGVYVVQELHRLDNLATEKIHMQRGINLHVKTTLESFTWDKKEHRKAYNATRDSVLQRIDMLESK